MKPVLLACLLMSGMSLTATAEELSPVDVQLLLDKLEELRKGEKGRRESRFAVARSAFAAAVQSDAAAHALYLKCIEKVRFDDDKSGQAWRDWKRRHKERGDTPALRRALRHQLAWFLLTLDVAEQPEDMMDFAPKALERLDAVFADAEVLRGEQSRLQESVLSTVYASAYAVGNLGLDEWPMGPLLMTDIYENLILPPLRRPAKVEQLRSAWIRRINYEGLMVEKWGSQTKTKSGVTVGMDRYLTERRPEMIWEMEQDLFRAGDEKGAALRMLTHIERYLGHRNETRWIEGFEALIKGELPGETAAEDNNGTTEQDGR
jgi:hypothetical protein